MGIARPQLPFSHTLTNGAAPVRRHGDRNVAKDTATAIKWWVASAELNFAPALFNLGVAHCKGLTGAPADLDLARSYFIRANQLNPNLVLPHALFAEERDADDGDGSGPADGGDFDASMVGEEQTSHNLQLYGRGSPPRFSAGVDPDGTPLGYARAPDNCDKLGVLRVHPGTDLASARISYHTPPTDRADQGRLSLFHTTSLQHNCPRASAVIRTKASLWPACYYCAALST